ncbi:MAG: tetratricopeptide repeat protein [Bacteroidales bacterium]|nr:tetratricopeptide repeat protein [Bacteroidales bacterium]
MKNCSLIFLLSTMLWSCSNDQVPKKEELLKNIYRYEQTLLSDTTGNINIAATNEAIKYYSAFAYYYPDDSLAPEYLYRKACLLRSMGKYTEAIKILMEVENNYQTYKNLDVCVFTIADIYENLLYDTTNARKYYMRVLHNYPNSKLSDDIKVILQNLGKSPEELWKQIIHKDSINKNT